MNGHRQTFACPSCGKNFTYWVADGNPQPKVKCTFCAKESYPNGEPPPAVAASVPAPAAAPASAAGPASPASPKPPTA